MVFLRRTQKTECQNKIIMLNPNEICLGKRIRHNFDEAKMNELCTSIEQNGIVSPIGVRQNDSGKYEVVFGYRRLKAARILLLDAIPCMLCDCTNPVLQSLIENLQREELGFFEQADGIYALQTDYMMSRKEIAEKIGLSESAISNKLRLLRLSESQRESIENMNLTERHARTLLRICDDKLRTMALREMIDKAMNVEQAEKYVDKLLEPKSEGQKRKFVIKDIRLFVNSINKAVNVMKVSGINASTSREEDDNFIKYTVLIPKPSNNIDNDLAI